MSWSINENTGAIEMTKGDTPSFKVTPKILDPATGDTRPFEMQEGDEIIFAVKKNADGPEPPCIVKKVPIDSGIIQLERNDTKNLTCGVYRYEVSFTRGSYTCTFIEGGNKTFTIRPEIL